MTGGTKRTTSKTTTKKIPPKRGGGQLSQAESMRRDLFCRYFIQDLNGTEAALKAGFGRTKEVAQVQAFRLLSDAKIQERLEELAKLRPETLINHMVYAATADITDVVEWDEDGVRPIPSRNLTKKARASIKKVSVVTRTYQKKDGEVVTETQAHFELHDKLRALEKLMDVFKITKQNPPILVALQTLVQEGLAQEEDVRILDTGLTQIEENLKERHRKLKSASTEEATD